MPKKLKPKKSVLLTMIRNQKKKREQKENKKDNKSNSNKDVFIHN